MTTPTATRQKIPVYRPDFSGNESTYILECLDTIWTSSIGQGVGRFDSAIRDFTGSRHATAFCNGTAILPASLLSLPVTENDLDHVADSLVAALWHPR